MEAQLVETLDVNDSTPALIQQNGYKSETHKVHTEDGYILEMHRILCKVDSTDGLSVDRPVVYLQHGLLCSSADWVLASPKKSLGFILSDAGYDVWLGNYRGNTYSRGHKVLRSSDKAFWKFSWDEMGKYDIPAMITKILEETSQKKIFYIGHSMGTTGFMVMANERPDMLDHIHLASLMAPVAYVDNMKSPVRHLAPLSNTVGALADLLRNGEMLPHGAIMNMISLLVSHGKLMPKLAKNALFLLCGFNEGQMNQTILDAIVRHTPAGTSARTVLHYVQEFGSKVFAKYDHGKQLNLDIYGQEEPPKYKVKAVNVPVASYWSGNDWLAQPEDVLRYLSALPKPFATYQVPLEDWNHMDFLYGIDADTLLYPEVLQNMEAFRQRHL